MSAGDIVWVKYGRIWYPAQVCTHKKFPEPVLQKLTKNIQGKVFVKWWREDNFSVITESNVEPLAQNKVDERRATRSAQIAKEHHSTLSEVIDI